MPIFESLVKPKIQLNLSDPNMTWLHGAGMAGLWMTLKQLEKIYPICTQRVGNLTWSLTPRSISLFWEGQDFIVLDWLLKQSFQISDNGLIFLMGLNNPLDVQTQIVIHQGITATFLQHNKFFKSAGAASSLITIDKIKFLVKYKKAAYYANQHFAKHLCNNHGQLLQESIGITGWLYPGATVRHYAFSKQTKFEEKPEYALILLFAPMACQYFALLSPIFPDEIQYALIIPKVLDLELYAQYYWQLGNLSYKYFHASSIRDAGLKFLTYANAGEMNQLNPVKQCQVILFGTADWSERQKTRIEIAIVELNEKIDYYYQICRRYFADTGFFQYKNQNCLYISFVRGMIADNLAKGFPWWSNFYIKIKNKNLLNQIFKEHKQIYNMIQNSNFDFPSQKFFILACHEALRKRYAKIYSNTKEGDYAQIERENKRLVSQLGRCTNADNFRKFIAEFWGKAGQISILQEHWEELLPITTGATNWQVARDLTFIAFASYQKRKEPGLETSGKSES
jgi:CRISPR-associated protein Cas8a1/Csx13